MAGKHGYESDPLMPRLKDAAHRFDFFQAVRLLECAHPDKPRMGHSARLVDDPVRFCQRPSLAFAPSTIDAFEPRRGGQQSPRLYVNFMGLFGPNGPMPLHITEYARDRMLNSKDDSFVHFLDVFHHRMLSLFYRAWAGAQQVVHYDRPESDRFGVYIGSLIGIGMDAFRQRDAVPDAAKLFYSGRFVGAARSAEGIEAVLEDYFGFPTKIEEFIGRWIEIPSDYRCFLGQSPATGTLGSSALVGSRTWDCQQKFRIKIGPLDLDSYKSMLPGGHRFLTLRDWVRAYVGFELDWDVQFILRAEEIPTIKLGEAGRLGWSTWLRSGSIEMEADDLILRPEVA